VGEVPAAGAATTSPIPRPPDALLVHLQAAADRGDIIALRAEITRLRQQAPHLSPFLEELETLAAGYQMTALRQRLAPAPPHPPPPSPAP
jgi:hypothetical protein